MKCRKINIVMRMLSGDILTLEEVSIGTDMLEIQEKILPWVYDKQAAVLKEDYDYDYIDFEDLNIDLVYKDDNESISDMIFNSEGV